MRSDRRVTGRNAKDQKTNEQLKAATQEGPQRGPIHSKPPTGTLVRPSAIIHLHGVVAWSAESVGVGSCHPTANVRFGIPIQEQLYLQSIDSQIRPKWRVAGPRSTRPLRVTTRSDRTVPCR
jgi:hypothetical protein